MKELAILIPAYNEEKSINECIENWSSLKIDKDKFDIIIANDGSTDSTLNILKEKQSSIKNLIVLSQKNLGHGPTIINLYKYALKSKYEYIFQTDSDNQFLISDFYKLWNEKNNFDFICGKRHNRKDKFHRLLITNILKFLIYLIYFKNLPDVNSPFRLFKTKNLINFFKIIKDNCLIPNIFLSIYASKNYKIKFINVEHLERKEGTVSILGLKLINFCIISFFQFISFRFRIKL